MPIPALLITDNDFKNSVVNENFPFRIMGFNPPHRYNGWLEIEDKQLIFEGKDILKQINTEIAIPKKDILQIYYGFDEVYNRSRGWGLGLGWKPIRLQVQNIEEEISQVYIIAGFNGFTSQNQQLLEALKEWLL